MHRVDVADLDFMVNIRPSTKKLDGGPMKGGSKPSWGKPVNRHSIPANVREDLSYEFGTSSYHKGELLNLYDVLTHKYFKD